MRNSMIVRAAGVSIAAVVGLGLGGGVASADPVDKPKPGASWFQKSSERQAERFINRSERRTERFIEKSEHFGEDRIGDAVWQACGFMPKSC